MNAILALITRDQTYTNVFLQNPMFHCSIKWSFFLFCFFSCIGFLSSLMIIMMMMMILSQTITSNWKKWWWRQPISNILYNNNKKYSSWLITNLKNMLSYSPLFQNNIYLEYMVHLFIIISSLYIILSHFILFSQFFLWIILLFLGFCMCDKKHNIFSRLLQSNWFFLFIVA
mgnify:CR=1 FL=1